MFLFFTNKEVCDVKRDFLVEKIQEKLVSFDSSCYNDDNKTYRFDVMVGKQVYAISCPARIIMDSPVFGDMFIIKRVK